ncbi:MAG TPA: universal stress protein [Microlunatus sp.]|nr:universal stress protein [Microlunatus sp.]
MAGIVVGVDLSDAGVAALRWAAQQARLTGESLRAIHVLKLPDAYALAGLVGAAVEMPVESINSSYREALDAMWGSVEPDDGWSLEYVVDDPRGALVAASAEATLVVVGTREHTGFERFLSGSVSHYVLSHALCPVVAVPPARITH